MDEKFGEIMAEIDGKTIPEIDKSIENLTYAKIITLMECFRCKAGDLAKKVAKYKGVKK